jgi:dTMP kinase
MLLRKPFAKLWAAQFISSMGDWIGLVAIVAIAAKVSNNSEIATSLVLAVRILPSLFLGGFVAVIIDKMDRKKMLIMFDIGRGVCLFILPFWSSLIGLVVISFVIELFSLIWSASKEASVPNMVSIDRLTTANSLSMIATYGTIPVAFIVYRILSSVEFNFLSFGSGWLALWVDGGTYLVSAIFILLIPKVKFRDYKNKKESEGSSWVELKEGLSYLVNHNTVRAVVLGLGLGLAGGGSIVPLGSIYSKEVLGSVDYYSTLTVALGLGAAAGVVALLFIQKYVPIVRFFWSAILLSGAAIIITATFSNIIIATIAVACIGGFAGSAYVTGFTILQKEVDDDIRGKTFTGLTVVIKVALMFSLIASPILSNFLGAVVEAFLGENSVGSYGLPGVRIALWVAGATIIWTGFSAKKNLKPKAKIIEKAVHDEGVN